MRRSAASAMSTSAWLAGRRVSGRSCLVHERSRLAMQAASFAYPGACLFELGLVAAQGEAGQFVVELEQQLAGSHPIADVGGNCSHQPADPRREFGPALGGDGAAQIEDAVTTAGFQRRDFHRRGLLLRMGAGKQGNEAGECAEASSNSVHSARAAAAGASFHTCQS